MEAYTKKGEVAMIANPFRKLTENTIFFCIWQTLEFGTRPLWKATGVIKPSDKQ